MVAQIDAINQGVVLSFPSTASSNVVIYRPASIIIPAMANMRLGFEFIIKPLYDSDSSGQYRLINK